MTDTAPSPTVSGGTGAAQTSAGMTLYALVTALTVSLVVFGIQMAAFFLLRNVKNLARIFKPKTYLVPERERTDAPPVSPWNLVFALMKFRDREIIKKCGLDAYFFLRYLQTLLIIFVPIALIAIPILIPINFVGGLGQEVIKANNTNETQLGIPTGLDTLAWINVAPKNSERRWVHLFLALCVIIWVCVVFFAELRVYVKVRQDYLTSAEHRLRASANTVLVSSIPDKWLTEDALRGLFDVFPGGIRNVWLTRDFSKLLEKIHKRDAVHKKLEAAETKLIREAKKKQLKLRAAEEKRNRKALNGKSESKQERAERAKREDEEAKRRAEGPGGLTAGAHEDVPEDVTAAVTEAGDRYSDTDLTDTQEGKTQKTDFGAKVGGGIAKVGQGLGLGLKKAVGGAKMLQKTVGGELGGTGGFAVIDGAQSRPATRDSNFHPPSRPGTRDSNRHRRVPTNDDHDRPKVSFASESPLHTPQGQHTHSPSDSEFKKESSNPKFTGNTTRKVENLNTMLVQDKTSWYQFWKPPTGSYLSPIPQGYEGDSYPWEEKDDRSVWQKIKAGLPFKGEDEPSAEYPPAYTRKYDEEPEDDAEWKKWLKPSDRSHHRLPRFEWTPSWLPSIPGISKKVDTIYWCRAELARLNVEIEEDQQHPERYPIMNSAFIQFNNQAAAHMACQSVTHHVPKRMAPRMIEISPDDVIWDNMAIQWWSEWARSAVVFAIVTAMILLWLFPVAFTASIAQIDALINEYSWLEFLRSNDQIHNVVKAVAGILPAILLAILLLLVPLILDFLAKFQGLKTGAQKSESVQIYYFVFLFVQVFLVVSIASGVFQVIADLSKDIASAPQVLARNLPKASNYFFTYFILQAMSTSSGYLLQIGTLFVFYILSRLFDNTAREKWKRFTQLPDVTWGSYFPVYTNFACIALIYSVVAPLISLFAIITFGLLWIANRYNMLYVIRFRTDTGGVLYPRAINQTFTGLYVMELCLVGLFGLVEDENGTNVCIPHSIIMLVAFFLTALYQYLLNSAFGPLLRYLPITFEDEALIRDEIFQRAQDKRLGLLPDDDEATGLIAGDKDLEGGGGERGGEGGDSIELQKVRRNGSKRNKLNPVRGIVHAGTWAARGGKRVRAATFGKAEGNLRNAAQYRRNQRQKDLEALRARGDELYGEYHDEIEDLTPEERDGLVRKAFQHYALRARRPTVWIPRDDIGVSDDEIRRTMEFSEAIWISNEGTALDSKVRVVYGRNPPDFSQADIISL